MEKKSVLKHTPYHKSYYSHLWKEGWYLSVCVEKLAQASVQYTCALQLRGHPSMHTGIVSFSSLWRILTVGWSYNL